MFTDRLHSFHRRRRTAYDPTFIQDVRVRRRSPRSYRSEALLAGGWVLIAAKTWAMFWLVDRYTMPFSAWWIVGPTLLAALVCTWIYLRRD